MLMMAQINIGTARKNRREVLDATIRKVRAFDLNS